MSDIKAKFRWWTWVAQNRIKARIETLWRGIKTYWLEILLGILAIGFTWLTWSEWMFLLGESTSLEEVSRTERSVTIRALAFGYGALGAFYGLILAARRLRINEAGLFSDRLGGAVDFLKNKELHIRESGVVLLESLHKGAEKGDKKLIRSVLLKFIRGRAGIYDSEKKTEPEPQEERVDIETAIKILAGLVSKEYMLSVKKEVKKTDIQQLRKRQEELDMQRLDLRNLDLSWVQLRGTDFSGANLQEANFWFANLQDVAFWSTDLQKVIFYGANLKEAKFQYADLQKADLALADLTLADLTGADLENVENLTQDQLAMATYEKGKPPKNLPAGLRISEHRAYTWKENENGNIRRIIIETGEWIEGPFNLLHF